MAVVSEIRWRPIVAGECGLNLYLLAGAPRSPLDGERGGHVLRQLPRVEPLLDIRDVEGFVRGTLESANVRVRDDDEHEELVTEGLTIMYELAAKFEVRRAGYDQDGKFSGFAAAFLPKRLGDAWHARHPEHRREQDPETGKRKWVYYHPQGSIDGERAQVRVAAGSGISFEKGEQVDAGFLSSRYWVPVERSAAKAA